MAADQYGADLNAVNIPTTGFAAIGPVGGKLIAEATLKAPEFQLPEDFAYLGLFTEDGGPTEEVEAGDEILFFQQGYSLPSGNDTLSETLTLAEDNNAVRRLIYGAESTGGVYYRTGAVPTGSFPYLRVTRYKNGMELRRQGIVHVSAIEQEQETRGEVRAVSVTFTFEWQQDLGASGARYQDVFLSVE